MKRDSAMSGAKRMRMWGALLLLTGAAGCGGGGGDSPADAGTSGDGGTSSTKILREEGRAIAYTANGLVVVGSTQVNREQSGADLLIRRYTPADGMINRIAGTGKKGLGPAGQALRETALARPHGVTIHPRTGELYITDSYNHRVLRLVRE